MRRTAYYQGSLSDSDSNFDTEDVDFIYRQQDNKSFYDHKLRDASKFDPSPENFPPWTLTEKQLDSPYTNTKPNPANLTTCPMKKKKL